MPTPGVTRPTHVRYVVLGLTISAYKAQVVFWKYLMLHEANRRVQAPFGLAGGSPGERRCRIHGNPTWNAGWVSYKRGIAAIIGD